MACKLTLKQEEMYSLLNSGREQSSGAIGDVICGKNTEMTVEWQKEGEKQGIRGIQQKVKIAH